MIHSGGGGGGHEFYYEQKSSKLAVNYSTTHPHEAPLFVYKSYLKHK